MSALLSEDLSTVCLLGVNRCRRASARRAHAALLGTLLLAASVAGCGGVSAGIVGLSGSVGAGGFEPQSNTIASQGAAYDLSRQLIVPISRAHTNVSLF